jgi:hypothetical protein
VRGDWGEGEGEGKGGGEGKGEGEREEEGEGEGGGDGAEGGGGGADPQGCEAILFPLARVYFFLATNDDVAYPFCLSVFVAVSKFHEMNMYVLYSI